MQKLRNILILLLLGAGALLGAIVQYGRPNPAAAVIGLAAAALIGILAYVLIRTAPDYDPRADEHAKDPGLRSRMSLLSQLAEKIRKKRTEIPRD